ncbi:hypothetical protein NDU88_006586 [Pleurodeles waltl]|uniref:Uncharacterized protein n=1 Tax=Pleurodeles waltl TaxID=8319 RepID=A0AAV7PLU9_PLEWA|nr:hypothetical protein NDU88_006586 [Pleurodeles waltl]
MAALLVSPLDLRIVTIIFFLFRSGSSFGSRFGSLLVLSLVALVLLRLASTTLLWILLPLITRLRVLDIRVGYHFLVGDSPESAPGVWYRTRQPHKEGSKEEEWECVRCQNVPS